MTDHLDPGYAAAAQARKDGNAPASRLSPVFWLMLGTLLVGLVLGTAVRETSWRTSAEADREEILATVNEARDRGAALAFERNNLAAQVDSARDRALGGELSGADLLSRIAMLEAAAATEPVYGPGLTVTLSDGGSQDRSIVLDRDLQAVVNALWESGAEAIAIGDVRIGPAVTVRHAGGAILVDNGPVFSPYRIAAIGPKAQLETGFVVSDAYLRMSALHQLYDVGFAVDVSDEVALPGASSRELRVAQEVGR
ncbi:DUF881 domain-containing protein [Antrihabitans sp. YC2-6]|nr:DUF881 domain-containing protein [Antrihabitans sp. YC2-6]